MRFQYTIHHVPRKTLYTTDMLSRANLQDLSQASIPFIPEKTEQFVQAVMASLPVDQDSFDSYSNAQIEDKICSKLIEYCTSG